MTDKFQDLQKKATETARTVGVNADKYVHDNTWQAIAIAAAVGAVLGLLLSRGRHNEY
jgi:ElaB/YqjD/DUF883 family membrane-anchored ribosome-binding protein